MNYFVTAIGTDCGKTVVSAILTEMLGADYWKPVQAGYPRDTETVQKLVTNDRSNFYREAYLLNTPASPHAAAKIDKIEITPDTIIPPVSNRDLVIEGAGGVMVPLNEKDLMIDLMVRLDPEVVLVSNLYLGSINHTLLTAESLKSRKLKVRGIIFNGEANEESERIITKMTGFRRLIRINWEKEMNKETVAKYANELRQCWD